MRMEERFPLVFKCFLDFFPPFPTFLIRNQSQTSSGELGDVGDSGRLRCLHGKAGTIIFM